MFDNAFKEPIRQVTKSFGELSWEFPYIQVLISAGTYIIVLIILCVLYPTVGVCIQIVQFFQFEISQTIAKMEKKNPFEKIGYVITIGVYFIVLVPFWLLQMPFYIIGQVGNLILDNFKN